MTEDEAQEAIREEFGPGVVDRLQRYVDMLVAENERQNLISRFTIQEVWSRHILDSAQLVKHMPSGEVLDIGSGAGLPGIVLAAIGLPVTLLEPRRKRVEFLTSVLTGLGLAGSVEPGTMRSFTGQFSSITARAVASLSQVFTEARHLAADQCVWVLPKGQSALRELSDAKEHWSGVFHVEQSVTNPAAKIIVAYDVKQRRGL